MANDDAEKLHRGQYDAQILIRLTASDKKKIEVLAKRSRLPVGIWGRNALLGIVDEAAGKKSPGAR